MEFSLKVEFCSLRIVTDHYWNPSLNLELQGLKHHWKKKKGSSGLLLIAYQWFC